MSGDTRGFNNMETRAVKFFFSAKQGAVGNSRHSERNINTNSTTNDHLLLRNKRYAQRFTPVTLGKTKTDRRGSSE